MSLNGFVFGVYPYVAGTVFLVGSWIRFDREQYTWKSDSSQLLDKRNMRLSSNLFHIGIIALFFGHFVGLLTPHALFHAIGVNDLTHQYVAIIAGAIFGLSCLVGGAMLWIRRMTLPRVRVNSRKMDVFILSWLMVTLLLGLSTLPVSWHHAVEGDPQVMLALARWVKSMVTLHANPALLQGVGLIFKIHLFFGMTVFLLFPFSRLVHIWSVPLGYLGRAYQLVRSKQVTVR